MKKLQSLLFNKENIQYLILITIGFLEVIYMVYKPVGNIFHNYFVPIICFFFLGSHFFDKKTKKERKIMLIGLLFVIWYYITFCFHYVFESEASIPGKFIVAYMIALPFSSVCKNDKGKGIKIIGSIYLLYSLGLVLTTILFQIDMLPSFLKEIYYYMPDGRLWATKNPNRVGMITMIGIVFSTLFSMETENKLKRALYVFLTLIQFYVMILTNSRTALFLCCAYYGGATFYYLLSKKLEKNKKLNLKELAILLLYGILASIVSFGIYRLIYTLHTIPFTPGNSADQVLETLNMASINERSLMWSAGIQATFKNPNIMLFGTELIPEYVEKYCGFYSHPHSSWIHNMLNYGIVGLLFSLYFGFMAIKNGIKILIKNPGKVKMWQILITMLNLILFVASCVEPYLFTGYYHYFNFMFFLCLGYMETSID